MKCWLLSFPSSRNIHYLKDLIVDIVPHVGILHFILLGIKFLSYRDFKAVLLEIFHVKEKLLTVRNGERNE